MNDEYYKSLFDQNPDGVFSLDFDGYITSINQSMERISGYDREYFSGKKYFEVEFIQQTDIELLKSFFNKARSGETQTFELSIIDKNSIVRHCVVTYFPIKVIGEIVGIFGILKDITSLKEMEKNLHRSEQKYRSLKLHNTDGICSFDIYGNLVGINPAVEKITGYSTEEFFQLNIMKLFNPKNEQNFTASIQQVLSGHGAVDSFEGTLITKGGKKIHTSMTIIPIFIDEKIDGFYIIVKDITKNKHTEELLIRSEKLSAVGQLAASIVHEIRNPLTSLMGFLQLMKSNTGMNDQYYQIMLDELTRINSITNELLVLSKPQVKQMKQENITSSLSDIVQLMNSQAVLHNVEIQLTTENDLPDIPCDIKQLKQVFINIIKNGIEAMEDKGGVITVTAKRKNFKEVCISFQDQGIGIPKEQLEHIGEPFYTTKKKGTGLGMSMIYTIVENHRGTLDIQSEVGQGTIVTVCLPIDSESAK
uniref:PAS domain-containing sensor histidine kinase n=1 Tax=Perspicuibacillus lycopersici TaxID=1325689 RepID=UPI00389B1E85